MKKWFVWMHWISPTMYAQNGIAVNEFLGDSWSHLLPNSTKRLGVQILESGGLSPYAYWYWISLAALLGFTALFNTLYVWALSFFNPPGNAQTFISGDNICVDEEQQQTHERGRGMVLPIEKHFITFDENQGNERPRSWRKQSARDFEGC